MYAKSENENSAGTTNTAKNEVVCHSQTYFRTIESVWATKYWVQIFLGHGLSKDFRPHSGKCILSQYRTPIF